MPYLADTPAGQVCPGCHTEVHANVCSLLNQGNNERVCRRVEKKTGRWQVRLLGAGKGKEGCNISGPSFLFEILSY